MAKLPEYIGRLPVPKFEAFLNAHGVEVLTPTNEWEVMRVIINDVVQVVYKNKKGQLSWQGCDHLIRAFHAWRDKSPMDAWLDKLASGGQVKKKSPKFKAIIDRDGYECFYCAIGLTPETDSVEHLLAKAHGGSSHISNLVLACKPHNREAGHLSIAEKVRMRDQLRSGNAIAA